MTLLPKTIAPLALFALALPSAVLSGLLPAPAAATPLPTGELELRCWLGSTRERTKLDMREPTSVSFSNLRDGYVVASPVLVEFAVRGMGVAPAGVKLPNTGHHHILVNRTLPTDIRAQIPFDDSHRHFGKGQTATLLELPAGKHRLRLLFADDEHRPHFVFSREIEIQVRGPRSTSPRPRIDGARFAETCAAWLQDELSRPRPPNEVLYIANFRADEPLVSPFNVRLGVVGPGVCARGPATATPTPNTGSFVLDVLDAGRTPVRRVEMVNGATQTNLALANGSYVLRLRFVDANGSDMLPVHEQPLRVVGQERS
jgi:hypothetical protein